VSCVCVSVCLCVCVVVTGGIHLDGSHITWVKQRGTRTWCAIPGMHRCRWVTSRGWRGPSIGLLTDVRL
jgi:hypothetical protein